MSLNRLFPGQEVYRSPDAAIPSLWGHLLSLPRQQALSSVAETLGVGELSRMSMSVRSAIDFGIVAPSRRRGRKDARMWTLAVLYDPSRALLFGYPAADAVSTTINLPREYLQVVSKLGNMRFDQHSGVLIWPAFIEQTANDIRLARMDANETLLMPFFDHKSGDYDCWLNRDFGNAFFFDHESCTLEEYCDGGFTTWMQQRFDDNLKS